MQKLLDQIRILRIHHVITEHVCYQDCHLHIGQKGNSLGYTIYVFIISKKITSSYSGMFALRQMKCQTGF